MANTVKKYTDPYARRVRDVMVRDLVSADANDTVRESLSLMVENRVSALPVVDGNGKCLGVISATDLIGFENDLEVGLERVDTWADQLSAGDMGERIVRELMTTPALSIDPEATLADAAASMLRDRVHRLMVVDQAAHLVGIVSTTDILTAFVAGANEAD